MNPSGNEDSHAPRRGPEPARKAAVDVIVVGGGVIGCAIGGRLAQAGLRCAILERGEPGRGASQAAAGMLSPLAEAEREGPFLDLGMRSLQRYPAFVAEVEAASGIDVEHRPAGKVQVAFSREEMAVLAHRAQFARTWSSQVKLLEDDAMRAHAPFVNPAAHGGLVLSHDHRLHSGKLTGAVRAWALSAGADIRSRTTVEGVAVAAGRVQGVQVEGGGHVKAPWVVVAAGSWSGNLPGLPSTLPVEPVRGQMVALGPGPCHLTQAVESARVYAVPREDGNIVLGSTEERAGFEARTTARGVADILEAALELLPALAHHPVDAAWAGLRPGTPDRIPILGPDPQVQGLLYATGHFRNGLLLAPETARIIAALVTGTDGEDADGEDNGPGAEAPLEELLEPFRPDRF